MEKKYSALRLISLICKFTGWLAFAIGGLSALRSILNSINSLELAIGILIFVIGCIFGLGMLASSEIIYVIIDIEENTRNRYLHVNSNSTGKTSEPIRYLFDKPESISTKSEEHVLTTIYKDKNHESKVPEISEEEKYFNKARLNASQLITSHGHLVSMIGNYPSSTWVVKFKDGRHKKASSLRELQYIAVELG